jgi:hypothetical protein
MHWLTEDARLVCKHKNGIVSVVPTQDVVSIHRRRVLVEPDPEQKVISGCPQLGPAIKPCTVTLKVQTGYSSWICINGRRICLDRVTGLTDGTPPGVVQYLVREAGQSFVKEQGAR